MFLFDGVLFAPAMTLVSVTTVIPYFLEQYGASAFQIGLAASLALICSVVPLPFFGSIASRTVRMGKTFGKILLLQRIIFMLFIFSIPLFSPRPGLMVIMFLVFWSVFNVFVASYSVFYGPLVLKLLPPDKRGAMRGIGFTIGSLLGMAMASLIPVVIGNVPSPYSYMILFSIGTAFLIADGVIFACLREHDDIVPREHMSTMQYIKKMPEPLRESPAFRTMITACAFLAVAHSALTFYTVYAIRAFQATESHIATLAALTVMSNAAAYIFFGKLLDRHGPVTVVTVSAALVMAAGAIALITNSLAFLFVAWVVANLGYTCYAFSASLLTGELDTKGKLPLYVGVFAVIPMAFSSAALLVLAPLLERFGFHILFMTVSACGAVCFLLNIFILKKRLRSRRF